MAARTTKSRGPGSKTPRAKPPTAKQETRRHVSPDDAALAAPGGEEIEEVEEVEVLEPTLEDLAEDGRGAKDALVPEVDGVEILDGADVVAAPARGGALVPAPERGIVRYNALQAYIHQIRQYALLDPEEEHALAVKFREEGDVVAARKLVTANLRLVVKIAHEYRKAYQNILDLVQEGNIGLMHAVQKFDPYRGVKLSSYAAWWIRAYILKFILSNWRLVKIGTTQAQRKLFFNLRKEVERLEALGVENPGPKLLAERLDVTEEEVQSMQRRLAGADLSLDTPLVGDDPSSGSRLDFVADRSAGPEESVETGELQGLLKAKLAEFRKTLSGRDLEIFDSRTVAEEPLTLQEIGDRYAITRERARQIERRMLDRLRDFLRRELGDAVDIALGVGE
jgi:RNA polymerase sigma-32 factor